MASGYEMRVGDAEREAAAAELREHFASGRLDSEELDTRLAHVFAAKTRGDLNALFADLPSSSRDWSGQQPAGSARSAGPAGSAGQGAPGAGWPGAGWPGAGWWSGPAWQGRGPWAGGWPGRSGDERYWDAGRRLGAAVSTVFFTMFIVMSAMFVLGILWLFGIGGGRPFGIVLILAALALLRRIFFGRRVRGCGPRRRRW